MKIRAPTSLRVTVPLILLGFAATLSAISLVYHVPRAEEAAEDGVRKRMAQEMSRLQSTLEYLLLKGDVEAARHEIAVLAHNHDVRFAALVDEGGRIVTATRLAWIGRPIADVLPVPVEPAGQRQAGVAPTGMTIDPAGDALVGRAALLIGGDSHALHPSRTGVVFLAYDLSRYRAEARTRVLQQSVFWSGCVAALALAMWVAFHFLLTRRTASLVDAAERFAAGDRDARSRLAGADELARLSRAFDAMAREVADTENRLRSDIAERARVQRALEDSEARLQQILDNATAVVYVKDTNGRLLFVNRQWERVFGIPQDAAVGRKQEEVLPANITIAYGTQDQQVLQKDAPIECEESVPLGPGGRTYISMKFPLHDATGTAYAVCNLSTDITEKKLAAEQLARQRDALHQREKLAALGSLLAGVSHELNNPLSVVVARAVLLEERGDVSTRLAAHKIRAAAERCSRIVRTFLAMARQQQPARGPVVVNDVVAAALDITGYALRTSSIEVTLDLAPGIPAIHADGDQLHQVLLNLIINAQQALRERTGERRITVQSRVDEQRAVVRVSVADNGPGIPSPIRARIFEPYFTTKDTGVGLGVGLAVSLGIVEAHGGSLTVDCPAQGGAVFTVELPLDTTVSEDAGGDPPVVQISRSREILVVDDEPDIRETLRDILGDRHRVTVVGCGRDALSCMESRRYDAILTDIRMPDGDGRWLYREIERRWPERAACVVFVTGDTLATDLRRFVGESGRAVIEKPFLPEDVRRVVAQLLDEASLRAG